LMEIRRSNYIIPATSAGMSATLTSIRLNDVYTRQCGTRVSDTRYDSRIGWIWQVSCEKVKRMLTTEQLQQASPDSQQGTP
jgi:hypothetical protein